MKELTVLPIEGNILLISEDKPDVLIGGRAYINPSSSLCNIVIWDHEVDYDYDYPEDTREIIAQTEDKIYNIPMVDVKYLLKPSYRVGRKNGRAVIEENTGLEYVIFPKGKEKDAQDYCDYLNSRDRGENVKEIIKSDLAAYEALITERRPGVGRSATYHRGKLSGYNAAPKGGFTREDIEKAVMFGHGYAGLPSELKDAAIPQFIKDIQSRKHLYYSKVKVEINGDKVKVIEGII